ncbi:EEP domain-containing protein [Lysobacter sp. TY2-98]|uniref:endonuclease/exonuclease/phosphatase family protein n=1 Tax=Lysobacter sp. TY2-98 TaxID=2290922 RepID=UPI000E1FCA37|nr:endonuclease/exonuclease/phosphatase family protein [Lysobacter sp. TY2-98]AXK73468.1 EEP domain-containing protein [Lysobacter sp. TY2-98]
MLSANIQAGSSTRGYHDYVARSWSHVLPMGDKRASLDAIARLAAEFDIVGLQESDPGSLRSGFTNQTHYLAQRAGFAYWSHQPNRRVGGVASSANGLLSRLEPTEVVVHSLPGRVKGRGVMLARFGKCETPLTIAVAHLSLGASSRLAQLGFIADLLADDPHAVLMGDFNCTIDTPEMEALFKRTRLQPPAHCVPTFPSWAPQRAIDHILVGSGLKAHDRAAMPAAFSDHLALSIELDVPEHCLQ